jgi:hypothetical protein
MRQRVPSSEPNRLEFPVCRNSGAIRFANCRAVMRCRRANRDVQGGDTFPISRDSAAEVNCFS